MKNFKKSIALTTALMFCSLFLYGQQLKTYVDKSYDGPCGGTGTLTYTYYEGDNGDYVKHGKYTANASWDQGKYWDDIQRAYVTRSLKYSASANYKDDWLNGTLTITVSNKYTTSSKSQLYVSTLTANFKDGVPHGNWKMIRTENGKTTYSLSVNFSNGILVGSFAIDNIIKGQLDNDGFLVGKWIKKEGNSQKEYNFINHVYVSMYERKDGKVIWSRPDNDNEKDLFKDYAEGQITADELNRYGYIAEESYSDLIGTKFLWDILYEGLDCFGLDKIEGDKTNDRNRPERVTMGKYISLKKVKDVKILQFEDENKFANFAKEKERYLENVLFEDTRTIKSAEELWAGYWLNQDQKKTMTSIYNKYVKEVLPEKLQRIEEKKRKAEEEERRRIEMIRQAEEKRQEEALRNHSDSIHVFITSTDYTSLIDAYNNEVINLRTDIENNQMNTSEKLEKLKELTKIQETYLSFADIEKQFAEYNEMLMNEKISEFSDLMELYDYLKKNYKPQYSCNNVNEIKKKADSYIQVLKELLNLTKYRNAISRLNDTILVACEPFPDIAKSYMDMRAASDLIATHNLQDNAEKFVSHYNTQLFYQRFIELRKSFTHKNAQINQNKQHEDVVIRYNDFVKNCDYSISKDTTESFSRVLSIVKTQDTCLKFLSLRDEIANINNVLSGNKIVKNIAKIYDIYMKSADLIWTPDLNCCDKLRKVIDIQNQFLAAFKALNAAELDKKIKKLKDKSLENVLKEIK